MGKKYDSPRLDQPNISNFAVSKWHPKNFLGHRTSIFDLFKGWAMDSEVFYTAHHAVEPEVSAGIIDKLVQKQVKKDNMSAN